MASALGTEAYIDLKSLSERLSLSDTDLVECHSTVFSLDEIEVSSQSSSTASTPATEYAQSTSEDACPPNVDSDHIETQATQNALIVTPERQLRLVSDFPVPETLDVQEVMIRNYVTGLNHIDWKSIDYNMCLPELPWVLGREMAGVVERVGSEVTRLKRGDRVWTSKYLSLSS